MNLFVRNKSICLIFLCFGIALALPAAAEESTRSEASFGEGRAIVVQKWSKITEDLEDLFRRAHNSFLTEQRARSAGELRQALQLIKLQASRASGSSSKKLERSISELNNIAAQIENGTWRSVKALEPAYARACLAIAQIHQQNALDLLIKNPRGAGEDLDAAVVNLENGYLWLYYPLDDANGRALTRAHKLAFDLLEGKSIKKSEEEMEALVNALDADFQNLANLSARRSN